MTIKQHCPEIIR